MDVKMPDNRLVVDQERYIGFKRLFCMIPLEEDSSAAFVKSQGSSSIERERESEMSYAEPQPKRQRIDPESLNFKRETLDDLVINRPVESDEPDSEEEVFDRYDHHQFQENLPDVVDIEEPVEKEDRRISVFDVLPAHKPF